MLGKADWGTTVEATRRECLPAGAQSLAVAAPVFEHRPHVLWAACLSSDHRSSDVRRRVIAAGGEDSNEAAALQFATISRHSRKSRPAIHPLAAPFASAVHLCADPGAVASQRRLRLSGFRQATHRVEFGHKARRRRVDLGRAAASRQVILSLGPGDVVGDQGQSCDAGGADENLRQHRFQN